LDAVTAVEVRRAYGRSQYRRMEPFGRADGVGFERQDRNCLGFDEFRAGDCDLKS
jgi:hypothetical protein